MTIFGNIFLSAIAFMVTVGMLAWTILTSRPSESRPPPWGPGDSRRRASLPSVTDLASPSALIAHPAS